MQKVFKEFLKYTPWAFVQQLLVVGIFVLLSSVMPVGWAILISATLFSLSHLPNLFLMVVGFFLEGIFLFCYKDITSLIWMIGAHSLLAVLIHRYIPETITHGMKVLWSYWKEK